MRVRNIPEDRCPGRATIGLVPNAHMTSPISIEIEADSPVVEFELMGSPKFLSKDDGHQLPGGGVLYWRGSESRRGFGFRSVAQFLLHIGDEVGAGLIAAYLYDKLKKGRATRLRIDRAEVKIDKGEITSALEVRIGENKAS